jgi:Icc-related predicted phosphoesterase
MRILYATDLHFNKELFKKIESSDFDIALFSGDLIDSALETDISEQREWVANLFRNFKKPIFACSGNHDIEDIGHEDWLDEFGDNSIQEFRGFKIGLIPYIGADFQKFTECDILVTHIPPTNLGVSLQKGIYDWGDMELRENIENGILSPKVIFSGHIHSPKEKFSKIGNTVVINGGFSSIIIDSFGL